MTASAMMMQACMLQQQRASVMVALASPSYFGLSSLFNSFLPSSSLLGGFPRPSLLSNSCMPFSTSLSVLSADNESHRSVAILMCCIYKKYFRL